MHSFGVMNMDRWHAPLLPWCTCAFLYSVAGCNLLVICVGGGVLDWGGFNRMPFCMNFLGCLSGADPEARVPSLA